MKFLPLVPALLIPATRAAAALLMAALLMAALLIAAPPVAAPCAAAAPLMAAPRAAAAPPVAAAPAAPPAPIVERLPDGLTAILCEEHHAATVTIQTWVPAGTADERPGVYGVAHLLEHLQFIRPGRSPRATWEAELVPFGAEFDGVTGRDRTVYTTTVPSEAWPVALEMEMARLKSPPVVSDSLFRRERKVMALETAVDAPRMDRVVEVALLEALFPGHPYGRSTWSPDSDLANLLPTEVRRFFERHYRPDGIAVVVAGDVDAAAALAMIRRLAPAAGPDSFPPGGFADSLVARHAGGSADTLSARRAGGSVIRAAAADSLPPPRGRDIRIHRTGALAQVWVGFSVPGVADPARAVWPIVADVLGGSRKARLARALIDSLGLAAAVTARCEIGLRGGFVLAGATLSPGADPDRCTEAMLAVLDRLCATGPTAAEVERGSRRLEARAAVERSTHAGLADEIGTTWWLRGAASGTAVDPPSIRRALGRFAAPDRRVVLVVDAEEPFQPASGK